ncbi:MAG: cytochrome c-type biogenesis CcmF C-terminal domain-containing protein [Ilumatobacteraceae bacterium]
MVCGRGTPWRTPASCHGSPAPGTSTRCAGAPRHVAGVEPQPAGGHVLVTILGTFTRSGVINSVHALADGSVGPYLLGAFVVIVAVSLGLIAWRGDRLRSPGAIDSPVSREGAFLANNVVSSLFVLVILLGTVFPLIVEAKDDRKDRCRHPVLRHDGYAHRAGAAVPDGHRACAAVAQGRH